MSRANGPANGVPHGPIEIALAFLAALAVYPISRLLRLILRR
jgi:hypothetical protein